MFNHEFQLGGFGPYYSMEEVLNPSLAPSPHNAQSTNQSALNEEIRYQPRRSQVLICRPRPITKMVPGQSEEPLYSSNKAPNFAFKVPAFVEMWLEEAFDRPYVPPSKVEWDIQRWPLYLRVSSTLKETEHPVTVKREAEVAAEWNDSGALEEKVLQERRMMRRKMADFFQAYVEGRVNIEDFLMLEGEKRH